MPLAGQPTTKPVAACPFPGCVECEVNLSNLIDTERSQSAVTDFARLQGTIEQPRGKLVKHRRSVQWLLTAAGGVYFGPAEQVGNGEGAGGLARQGWPEAGVEGGGRVELE